MFQFCWTKFPYVSWQSRFWNSTQPCYVAKCLKMRHYTQKFSRGNVATPSSIQHQKEVREYPNTVFPYYIIVILSLRCVFVFVSLSISFVCLMWNGLSYWLKYQSKCISSKTDTKCNSVVSPNFWNILQLLHMHNPKWIPSKNLQYHATDRFLHEIKSYKRSRMTLPNTYEGQVSERPKCKQNVR